jgi:intracellular multiplication protein IcmK
VTVTTTQPQQPAPAPNGGPAQEESTTVEVTQTAPAGEQHGQAVGPPVTGLNMRDQAFSNMVNSVLPLSPDQIQVLHRVFNDTQQAVHTYPGVPPKPVTSAQQVDLSPGATPPYARLRAGFVSSLVFLDSTGAPWPIKAYDISDPRSFNVQWDKESNTLLVQAITQSKEANLGVILRGKNTPIMITLMPGQQAVDYRIDYRVPGLGPNAVPQISGLPSTESPILLQVLNGVPPRGSEQIFIKDCDDCKVWRLGGRLFVKSRLEILSPGWISKISSADDMHAYELPMAAVILASYHGKVIQLKLVDE